MLLSKYKPIKNTVFINWRYKLRMERRRQRLSIDKIRDQFKNRFPSSQEETETL